MRRMRTLCKILIFPAQFTEKPGWAFFLIPGSLSQGSVKEGHNLTSGAGVVLLNLWYLNSQIEFEQSVLHR